MLCFVGIFMGVGTWLFLCSVIFWQKVWLSVYYVAFWVILLGQWLFCSLPVIDAEGLFSGK